MTLKNLKTRHYFIHYSSIFILGVLFFPSCTTSEPKEDEPKSENSLPKKEFDSEKLEQGKKLLNDLYFELIEFKNKKDFHEFGFGIGGKYNTWQKSVQNGRNNENYNNLLKVSFGDLETLGIEYLQNKGKENDYTKFVSEEFKRLKIIE